MTLYKDNTLRHSQTKCSHWGLVEERLGEDKQSLTHPAQSSTHYLINTLLSTPNVGSWCAWEDTRMKKWQEAASSPSQACPCTEDLPPSSRKCSQDPGFLSPLSSCTSRLPCWSPTPASWPGNRPPLEVWHPPHAGSQSARSRLLNTHVNSSPEIPDAPTQSLQRLHERPIPDLVHSNSESTDPS